MRCTTDTSEDTRYVYSEYGQLQVQCTEVLRSTSTCTCMHTSFVVKFKNFGMFVTFNELGLPGGRLYQCLSTSQGTADNGCCRAVITVGISSLPAESRPALRTQIPLC